MEWFRQLKLWFLASLIVLSILAMLVVVQFPVSDPAAAHPNNTPTPSGPTSAPPETAASAWNIRAQMPTARSEMTAAAIDGQIYVPGGIDNIPRATASLEVYDTTTDTWVALAPMPDVRHHHMTVAYGGKLYVFGGYGSSFRDINDTLFIYDPVTDSWTAGQSMPNVRAAGAAVELDGNLYIVGGTEKAIWRYDPVADTYQVLAEAQVERDHAAAVAFQGEIWLLGGRQVRVAEYASVEIYDPDSDTWREGPPMTYDRAGFGATVVGEYIVVAGGEVLAIDPFAVLTEVEVYHPDSDTWMPGPSLPWGLHGNPLVAWEGVVYVLGGAKAAGTIDNDGQVLAWEP